MNSEKARILDILDGHIKAAEEKAARSQDRHKYIMYGYWKAIAVHLRKVRREFEKGGEG